MFLFINYCKSVFLIANIIIFARYNLNLNSYDLRINYNWSIYLHYNYGYF